MSIKISATDGALFYKNIAADNKVIGQIIADNKHLIPIPSLSL